MKSNIILKILFATFACFALSFLIAQTSGLNHDERYPQSLFKNYVGQFACKPEDNSKNTTSIVRKYDAKEINEIEITLVNADVEVTKAPSTATEVQYDGASGLKLDEKIDGKLLKLSDTVGRDADWRMNCGPAWGKGFNFNFNVNTSSSSKLKLQVPSTIESLTIHTVSGDLHLDKTQLKHLDLKTVSGDLKVSGSYPEMSVKTVSGDIEIANDHLSPNMNIASTSGSVSLTLKKSLDAKVTANSVSGDFSILGGDKVSSEMGNLSSQKIFGHGKSEIAIHTVSGDMKIELQ